MDYTTILLKPLISEKATMARKVGNQVVFLVAPGANKIEVKQAVEIAFKVRVRAVNIVRKRPLMHRKHGRPVGRISGFKKVYVTLAAEDRIPFFAGI